MKKESTSEGREIDQTAWTIHDGESLTAYAAEDPAKASQPGYQAVNIGARSGTLACSPQIETWSVVSNN